jgi:DNA-binding MarR family transcriptional regulator
MSIKLMTAVWADDRITDRTEVLLLLALADHTNDKGEAYPGMESLAKKARCDQRTAQRVLRSLEKSGLVHIANSAGPKGTNLYRLTLDGVAPCRGMTQRRDDSGGDTMPPEVGGGKTPGGGRQAMPPEPSGTVSIGVTSKKRGQKADADPRWQEFVDSWHDAHIQQFGGKYDFLPRDFADLKRLLASTKRPASELMSIATKAWSNRRKGIFWSQKARSLSVFATRFNEILEEIERPMPGDIPRPAPKIKSGKPRAEDRPIPGDPDPDTGKPLTREEIETRFPLSNYEC